MERGEELVIDFTTPERTTDNLDIKQFRAIDLFVAAPDSSAAAGSHQRHYDMPLPPANTGEGAVAIPIRQTIAAKDWVGTKAEFRVRTAVKSSGGYSGWSNPVTLEVVAPLERPQLLVQATAQGYKLEWTPKPVGVLHRILRSSPGVQTPLELGPAQGDSFTDTTSTWNTPYTYSVIATESGAESLPSEPQNVDAPDTFPPSAPADVTAIASPNGVELSWQVSPETDLRGYYVYRSTLFRGRDVGGEPFVRVGTLLQTPLFSDTSVQHGQTYRYQVSAIDTTGNESARSASVDVEFP